jgi:hypothetical protein
MSQNEVVGIDIVARLDDFRSELAKIGDIGGKEAKALTAQLSREIKKSEKASKKAAEQSKKTAAAYKAQGKAAKKAASDTGGLTKAFNSTAKKAAALFLTIEMGKKVFTGIARAVGEVIEKDAEVERFKKQWVEVRNVALIPLSATVVGLASATAKMVEGFGDTGGLDRFRLAVHKAFVEQAIPAAAAFGATLAEIVSRGKILGITIEKLGALTKVFAAVVKFDDEGHAKAVAGYHQLSGELDRAVAGFTGIREAAGKFVDEARKGADAAAKSFGDVAAAAAKEVQSVKASAAGIIAARQKERGSYVASANERQAMADRAIADEERAAAAQKSAIAEVAAARDAAAEQERSLRTELATTAIETASNVANSIIDGLQNVLLANVQEAKKRRDIELGLAILRGELQAAAAFGTTLATYGGTPQGFALAAAAAAAVGISSKAAAGAAHAGSAEKFHSGGLARDESTAVLRAGEGILTPAAVSAVGGERGLQDLNAGASAMGDNGARTLQIGARAFDALVSQSLTSRGSVLTRSLASLRARPGGYKVHG